MRFLQAQVQLQRAQANLKRAERQLLGEREELAAVVGSPELELSALEDRLDMVDHNPIERETALSKLLACSPLC
jgi:outer membrane protein TolC